MTDISSNNDLPSAMSPTSARRLRALERIRSSREGPAAEDSSTIEDFADTNARRRELLRRRQQAREHADGGSETGDSITASRGRPPPRGGRSFRRNLPSETDDASAATAEHKTDKDKQHDIEEEVVEEGPIVKIQEAIHAYPLEILPSSRSSLNLRHPLLYFPAPVPQLPELPRIPEYLSLFPSTGPPEQRRDAIIMREERWQQDSHLFSDGTVEGADERSPEGRADDKPMAKSRISRSRKQQASDDKGDQDLNVADSVADPLLPAVAENKPLLSDNSQVLQHWQRTEDGVFVGRGAVMSDQLLRSEEVPPPLRHMISRGLALSRATQRLLRDLYAEMNTQAPQRDFWRQLHYQGRADPVATRLTDEGRPKPQAWRGFMGNTRIDNCLSGGAALLRQDEKDPTLRLCEDAVDVRNLQPFMTEALLSDADEVSEEAAASTKTRSQRSELCEAPAVLRISLKELHVTSHPYMSLEEECFVELKQTYSNYRALLQSHIADYLGYRLLAQVNEISRTLEVALDHEHDDDGLPDEVAALLDRLFVDFVETLNAMKEVKSSIAGATKELYKIWRRLVDCRKAQGFISTRACLSAKKLEDSREDSGKEVEEEDEEKPSIGRLAPNVAGMRYWDQIQNSLVSMTEMVTKYHEYQNQREGVSQGASSATSLQVTADGEAGTAVTPAELLREQKKQKRVRVEDMIAAAVSELRGGLYPSHVFRLTSAGSITLDDGVSPSELQRRQKMRRLHIRPVIKINGKVLASTAPLPLQWPALKIEVNRSFDIRVLSKPSEASIDLFSSYGRKDHLLSLMSSRETYLSTVGLPLPDPRGADKGDTNNVPSGCTVPSIGWLAFTATRLITASRGRGRAEGSHVSDIRIQGSLLCAAEYDMNASDNSHNDFEGVRCEDIATLPNRRQYGSELGGTVGGPRGGAFGSKLEFTRERDFFELLPPLHEIDVNDPKNDALVRVKRSGIVSGRVLSRDIFQLCGSPFAVVFEEGGVSYSNYLRLKESNRIKALRLRDMKPYLFTDPIPLSEKLVNQSEFLKNLFAKTDDFGDDDTPSVVMTSTRDEDMSAPEKPASKASSFLQKVRESNTAMTRKVRRKKLVTSSVVYQPYIVQPEINTFLLYLMSAEFLPQRKRALKPKPVERVPQAILTKKCDVLVQIVGAKNIPVRALRDEPGNVPALRKKSTRVMSQRMSREIEEMEEARQNDDDFATSFLRNEGLDTASSDLHRVRTFVEVCFQERVVRTTSLDGPSPMWKQSLSLPFYPPQGDFSHSNIQQVQDQIVFSVFDEVSFDDSWRGGFLEGESTERVEKRFVGNFSIPFSTLLVEKRIEGTFRLNTPLFNVGYENAALYDASSKERPIPPPPGFLQSLLGCCSGPSGSATDAHLGKYIDSQTETEFEWMCCGSSATYITVMATLDPLLSVSPYVDSDVSTFTTFAPDKPLVSYSQHWLKDLKEIGPHTAKRQYALFGTNSDGLSVLICRYLRAQKPPATIPATRRACVHLVSLIPFIQDAQAFVGEFDLWCTNKQMWDITSGDEEEHAVALYNFLYYISMYGSRSGAAEEGGGARGDTEASRPYPGYPSQKFIENEDIFLVIGTAIPEGKTVYVLIRKRGRDSQRLDGPLEHAPNSFLLINPCTGNIYSAGDPNCPVTDIACLITPYNIWANVQMASKPRELTYDILNPRNWRPFFGTSFRPPVGVLTSIQEEVEFVPTPVVQCVELEKHLRDALKTSLRRWRSKRPKAVTTFHAEACTVMTDLLAKLEEWKLTGAAEGVQTASVKHSTTSARSMNSRGSSARFGNERMPRNVLQNLEDEASAKLQNVLKTKKLYGTPINISYTDTEAVIRTVKALCMHELKHPDVLYVLSVRAFPHVNNLMSVWVFLGTIESDSR